MMKLKIGDKIGFLEIIGPIVTKNGKRSYSLARCVCGKEWMARRDAITAGELRSCGCKQSEKRVTEKAKRHLAELHASQVRHGQSGREVRSPEYSAWDGMIQRCHNPNSKSYQWYGARGIAVCDQWCGSFEAFYADMGPRPDGMSLERQDNARGYEPGNCVWATRHKQMRNTRYTRIVDVGGEKLCVRDAALKVGVPEQRIYGRVFRRGVSHQESVDYYASGSALGALLNGGLPQ